MRQLLRTICDAAISQVASGRRMLWIATLAGLCPGSMPAQEIGGIWQGSVTMGQPAKTLRVVFRVQPSGNDAIMYSIDQGGLSFPAAVQRNGPDIKMTVGKIGGIYEGKLDTDGNSMTGTWMQKAAHVSLILSRSTDATAWAIPQAAPPSTNKPQDPSQEWKLPIQTAFLQQFRLTQASFAKDDIVKPGTVVVIKRGNLALYATSERFAERNDYVDGKVKQQFASLVPNKVAEGRARVFVPGEKLWVTRILFEAKSTNVIIEFLSDAYNDVRFYGTLRFDFPKDITPTPEQFMTSVTQVLGVDSTPADAPQQQPSAATPAPVEAPPAEIPPPQRPSTEIRVGQTTDQIEAALGQPLRIAVAGGKKIYFYKDMKITFTAGKVTDIQ